MCGESVHYVNVSGQQKAPAALSQAMCGSVPSHRATHRSLCSNSSPRKALLSSPNHRTLRISFRVTFGCSLLWKWASRGRVSQPWKTSNATIELREIPKEAFRRCFQQWQDRWSKCVCVCAQGSYFESDLL